jgi:hypothetical protein
MNTDSRIYFAISAHGYGHLTQSIALARALLERLPGMELYIQCGLPRELIEDRLGTDSFHHEQRLLDVGLIQKGPLTPDIQQSRSAYRKLHHNYKEQVREEGEKLKQIAPDLLISDIPYLPIAAAEQAGVPSVALASLTWDYIIKSYFGIDHPESRQWYEEAQASYAKATLALLPTPAMHGDCFLNKITIPPIAVLGVRQPELRKELGIKETDVRPLILCSLGGITGAYLPIKAMEYAIEFHWLINAMHLPEQENIHSLSHCDHYLYKEIISSVDAVVGKPGYGMAVEAVALGIPFVFVQRGHFPDEPFIVQWLLQHGRAKEVTTQQWQAGEIVEPLIEVMAEKRKTVIKANGAEQGAKIITEMMDIKS